MFLRKSKKKIIYNLINNVEGGYSNDPMDPGGETNHGITKKVAEKNKNVLVNKFQWDGSMINLSKEMAYYLYDILYWKKCGLDDISRYSWSIASNMFGISVNLGTYRAVKYFQSIVFAFENPNAEIDGLYGNITLTAFKNMTKSCSNYEGIINECLISFQNVHYIKTVEGSAKLKKYIHGWTNRTLNKIKTYFC